jgi:hypothetical protein
VDNLSLQEVLDEALRPDSSDPDAEVDPPHLLEGSRDQEIRDQQGYFLRCKKPSSFGLAYLTVRYTPRTDRCHVVEVDMVDLLTHTAGSTLKVIPCSGSGIEVRIVTIAIDGRKERLSS